MIGDEDQHAAAQAEMIEEQLKNRAIRDRRVLDAFAIVPRHRFVLPQDRDGAYSDFPLPIGYGQTISQPYIVAYMVEHLQVGPHDKVLEIGTGSGYAAAILAQLAAKVYTIEVVPELYDRAKMLLQQLHFKNVICILGDGKQGLPDEAPFDRILLSAAPERMPKALLDQLRVGGKLIAPLGSIKLFQQLRLYEKTGPDEYREHDLVGVSFVELV